MLRVLHETIDAVVLVLADHDDWGPSGERPGQYTSDVVADRAAVSVLHRAGLRVLSEESGLDAGDGPIAVLDPLDGSTNASRAAARLGQAGQETIAALMSRLDRDQEPLWLKGDAVGALTALTGKRFGYDFDRWRRWWRERRRGSGIE